MIKYFGDRCGKEIDKGRQMYTGVYDALGALATYIGTPKHLCEECSEKLDAIKDQLKYEEDIFDMTDEDIDLLRYTFKVGDQVITDDGRTGTIVSICDCESCKARGFYEPTVDFGDYTDYIMISDKEDGFKSYYQIGDRVFGNLDEESINADIDECEQRMLQLYKQLGTIQELKMIHQHKKKEINNGN